MTPFLVVENSHMPIQENASHIPVMLKEVIRYLDPQQGNTVVDGTLGLAGHAKAILDKIETKGFLIGIDRDGQSLQAAKNHLKEYLHQCGLIQEDFRNMDRVLRDLNILSVDRILLDLGISSFQLDNPYRGFSLRIDGPLDMRLDQQSHIAAFDLINTLSEREIALVIRDFGEEKWYNRLAHAIIEERTKKPIETTRELRRIVLRAIPSRHPHDRIHPATRTFQAFRIAVNRELEALQIALPKCLQALKQGGRMAVIAFHSLEDRIVKENFQMAVKSGRFQFILKKPLRPEEEETRQNPRSRSARLRVVERIA